jgi:L-lactate dehydrogenase complex protein LldF
LKPRSHAFEANVRSALRDPDLQQALGKIKGGFIDRRRAALADLPEYASMQRTGREIKEHTLAHLDFYLDHFEQQVVSRGGRVHWARSAQEACSIIDGLCAGAGARRITKGKSMVGEEIGINDVLEAAGYEVVETDLGEYIIQLARESPSHIIAPAIHKTRGQIAALFRAHHAQYGLNSALDTVPAIVDEARRILRDKFIRADVGITGANFLIAETGSAVIVTNEGNGDLTATLPRMHIVLASLEKVVPTLEDASVLLRLLARSATGQALTAYTTFFTGPRRPEDTDGPEAFHVVLVDNGRSAMLGNEFRDMLRCIRCGACLNHCPVYGAVGGHAYGWVYPGPMGAVLTPMMVGLKEAAHLPNASTLCGRCEEVCPMAIPLPSLLRTLRAQEFQQRLTPPRARWALALWAFVARRPSLYRAVAGLAARMLGALGRRTGRLRHVPLAAAWTRTRDLPAPSMRTFMSAWRQQKKQRR